MSMDTDKHGGKVVVFGKNGENRAEMKAGKYGGLVIACSDLIVQNEFSRQVSFRL